MRIRLKVVCIFVVQLLSMACYAGQIDIHSLHYVTTENQLRMQFGVSASPKHRVFVLSKPARLVVDIENANLGGKLNQPPAVHPLFSKLRASKTENGLRLVFELKKPISAKLFALSTDNQNNKRLTIDLTSKEAKQDLTANTAASAPGKNVENPAQAKPAIAKAVKPSSTSRAIASSQTDRRLSEVKSLKRESATSKSAAILPASKAEKGLVIAIDAGHGGDDPGARGAAGTMEKRVVFAIAKKLAQLISAESGMKAVMVRKGDYYIDLRRRMHIARAAKADMFISIHADAFQDSGVRGASVYTLSQSGASSEAARWLAKSENAADLLGGVKLDDKEDVLASVLLDLSQSATQQASQNLAKSVLKSVRKIGPLHKNSVQKAGFLVLKSPDIPSILVETAYISNPDEEQRLLDADYQTKIAIAIFNGVRAYAKQLQPETGTRIAAL